MQLDLDKALNAGGWLILTGHDVAPQLLKDGLTTNSAALEDRCRYAADPAHGIWTDTAAAIGSYIVKRRTRQS